MIRVTAVERVVGSVASSGSVNVDRVAYLDRETRRAEQVPEAIESHVGETFPGGKGANQAAARSTEREGVQRATPARDAVPACKK